MEIYRGEEFSGIHKEDDTDIKGRIYHLFREAWLFPENLNIDTYKE